MTDSEMQAVFGMEYPGRLLLPAGRRARRFAEPVFGEKS
ncbi:hypothetical protein FHT79_003506 [Rhizobium sp. BK212]|nr:hypothetical protein [Rhizobium sp. BK212]